MQLAVNMNGLPNITGMLVSSQISITTKSAGKIKYFTLANTSSITQRPLLTITALPRTPKTTSKPNQHTHSHTLRNSLALLKTIFTKVQFVISKYGILFIIGLNSGCE